MQNVNSVLGELKYHWTENAKVFWGGKTNMNELTVTFQSDILKGF